MLKVLRSRGHSLFLSQYQARSRSCGHPIFLCLESSGSSRDYSCISERASTLKQATEGSQRSMQEF